MRTPTDRFILARHADSDGYTIDAPRQYRDRVIDAFNRDMPFDRFTIENIAGDMLPKPTVDQLIATGFHRNTPSNFEGGLTSAFKRLAKTR